MNKRVYAIILVGGPKIDRLMPLLEMPFCLIEVGGAELLGHLINNLIEEGINSIFIVGAYSSRTVPILKQFCIKGGQGEDNQIEYLEAKSYDVTEILKEHWDTVFKDKDVDDLLIIPGNVIVNYSIWKDLITHHQKQKEMITFLAGKRNLDKNKNGFLIAKNGKVKHYDDNEVPPTSLTFQSLGVQIINREIRDILFKTTLVRN